MKLKRLVSAVLAVGMALTMLPTAAFAADTTSLTKIDSITIVDGKPSVASDGNDYTGTGWSWTKASSTLRIFNGFEYSGAGDQIITCPIIVGSTENSNACLSGGLYTKYLSLFGEISGGTYSGGMNPLAGWKITGGVFSTLPDTVLSTISSHKLKVEIPNCTINSIIKDSSKSSLSAYVVGAQKITITAPARKFKDWTAEGLNITPDMIGDVTIDGVAYKTLTFTMPDNDVVIGSSKVLTPLIIKNGIPVDSENGTIVNEEQAYSGDAANDGWTYIKNTFTTTASDESPLDFVDLQNNSVKWIVNNNGILKNGTFTNNVTNNGTVENIVCTNDFTNNGTIVSGVFSRYAKFGEQNPSVRWVSVNSGTVNGMSVAGIVGKQTVTVKADTGFKCWSVSGDTDFTLTEEQKYNPELTLTLNGEDKGNIILTAQTEEGYYRLNLTDGKAYSATADGAKDQEINAAKPGDTVILEADASLIPDGMVFDRWEVTGDTELTGNFDAKAEKTSFTMPKSEVTLRAMYRMADQPEEPNVLGTVAMVATVGVGAAVVGYTGYMIGTELYLNTVLPEGTAIPNNTTELAKLLWTDAGKPAPAAVLAADATDEQKALTWAVENQLISADKAADASVTRWEVIDAWNKAQEMKKA